ncbi:MAG TPA: hypothetical protein VM165_12870 [Planctomycetaceae bacterium]|nr:hypothetical protein [Planctomycetaceae bacterium]
MPVSLHPLLAVDVGEWIGMAVLLLSFLGWIVNSIKGNAPDGQPRPPRPQPKRDLRSELEVFLEELQTGKPQPQPKPPAERPPQPVAKKQQRQPTKPKKSPPKPAPKTLVSQAAKPASIGGGVREHVATYMTPDRVASHAQSHIGQHRIDDAVAKDLAGGTVAAVAMIETPRATPHPLLKVLMSPDGVKQAILLQEILQRPRAFRR